LQGHLVRPVQERDLWVHDHLGGLCGGVEDAGRGGRRGPEHDAGGRVLRDPAARARCLLGPGAAAVIEFQDLHKAFAAKPVLDGLTLEVRDRETLVIIGYSGSGKSVALKHIVGLLHPDAGDVIVDGRAVSTLDRPALTALRREIGFVFQFAALFDSLTVADNVSLGLRRRGSWSRTTCGAPTPWATASPCCTRAASGRSARSPRYKRRRIPLCVSLSRAVPREAGERVRRRPRGGRRAGGRRRRGPVAVRG